MARTAKVWAPAPRATRPTGLEQDAYAAVSSLHSSVAEASASVNSKLTASPLGDAGVLVKTGTAGAVPSTTSE